MDKRVIQNLLQFLNRVQLQWNESEAATECKMALQAELKKEPINMEDNNGDSS